MNLSNYYWYCKSALTPKFCKEVIEYGLQQEEQIAITGQQEGIKRNIKNNPLNKQELLDLKKKRNSNIAWLNETWIYKEIHPYIEKANKEAGWNFDYDYSESCQFTKYKLNQYYDWHCDSWDRPYDRPDNLNLHGKIRKLSVTCQLTDGSEYKGGELEFDYRQYEPNNRNEKKHVVTAKEILPIGSLIVFPSFVWHRVKPVTEGRRYSLVIWNLGYPFK